MATQHCSNIYYTPNIDTTYDFTASFNYVMQYDGGAPTANFGFAIFFVNGSASPLQGGGCYEGIGVVSQTDVTSTSAINGIFLTLGLDYNGNFTIKNYLPYFDTGTNTLNPSSICLRTGTEFTYISSAQVSNLPVNIFEPIDNEQTLRLCVRNNFKLIELYWLNNNEYEKLVSFETLLQNVPPTAKFGIAYSGDTFLSLKNITFNYT